MLSIRKIGLLGRTYRQVSRYEQILRVLFRYGFSDLIDVLKVEQYVEERANRKPDAGREDPDGD
jgi:ubiquinone biosynthesis protein